MARERGTTRSPPTDALRWLVSAVAASIAVAGASGDAVPAVADGTVAVPADETPSESPPAGPAVDARSGTRPPSDGSLPPDAVPDVALPLDESLPHDGSLPSDRGCLPSALHFPFPQRIRLDVPVVRTAG